MAGGKGIVDVSQLISGGHIGEKLNESTNPDGSEHYTYGDKKGHHISWDEDEDGNISGVHTTNHETGKHYNYDHRDKKWHFTSRLAIQRGIFIAKHDIKNILQREWGGSRFARTLTPEPCKFRAQTNQLDRGSGGYDRQRSADCPITMGAAKRP